MVKSIVALTFKDQTTGQCSFEFTVTFSTNNIKVLDSKIHRNAWSTNQIF